MTHRIPARAPHTVTARRRRPRRPLGRDAGMSTAEYAVATLAACAFAAVLYQVLTSASVTESLHGVIDRAFRSAL